MATRRQVKFYVRYLPTLGCIATGLIYTGIGIIAILSFFRLKDGGADESSMFAYLDKYVVGKIFVWYIFLGTLCYIAWRIYETIRDPYGYGKDLRGLARRSGIALSTVADVLIGYSAVQILFGKGNASPDGNPKAYREMVGEVLSADLGQEIIIATGVVVCITALVQFFYGVTRGYKERLDIANFNQASRKVIHFLAWTGYFARGIILGITGFFFVKAGLKTEAEYIVNTDKAFDFIGDNIGGLTFIVVALGTIFYGFFMFSLGVTYDADKD